MNVEQIIDEFAAKYTFLQDADIENVEKFDFSSENYKAIDGKKYISIYTTNSNDDIVLFLGKINIIIETIDDEEWYYIDKNMLFSIYVNESELSLEYLEQIIFCNLLVTK